MKFGRFEGHWRASEGTSDYGYEYSFAFDSKNFVDVGPYGGDETVRKVHGYIEWILLRAPAESHCSDRIGEEAAEMVCGTFFVLTGRLNIAGYDVREENPYLIGADVYKIDTRSNPPIAKSKTHHTNWSGHMKLKHVANHEEIMNIFTEYYDDENIGEIMVGFFHDFALPANARQPGRMALYDEPQWFQNLIAEIQTLV